MFLLNAYIFLYVYVLSVYAYSVNKALWKFEVGNSTLGISCLFLNAYFFKMGSLFVILQCTETMSKNSYP